MKFKSNIPRLSAGWSRTKAKFLAPLLLILLSFLLLGVIIGTAQISFGLNSKSGWGSRLNASAMLSILSVMQALSTAVTGLAISSVFERLQWKFMARAVGLDVLGMLGLSPTTSLWGALRIGLHRRAVMSSRLWAMIRFVRCQNFCDWILTSGRLLLMGTVFVAGILLLRMSSWIQMRSAVLNHESANRHSSRLPFPIQIQGDSRCRAFQRLTGFAIHSKVAVVRPRNDIKSHAIPYPSARLQSGGEPYILH